MTPRIAPLLACLALAWALPAGAGEAVADLVDASGKSAGTATFRDDAGMVKLEIEAGGLAPGAHGMHLHDVGQCKGPDFKSAGPHFNPHDKQHGIASERGAHAGDLPNLTADASGKARLTAALAGLTLSGGKSALLDRNGAALVIHAQADDNATDPSGNSGDRVLCGVLKAR